MQLSSPAAPTPSTAPRALHLALATAVASLLGAPAQAADEASSAQDATPKPSNVQWQADGALLLYQESGGRVRAAEPVVAVRRTDGSERVANLKLTVDTLTGASPNGAVAQPGAQTFTSPSGRSGYTTPAGRTPLDPSFHDTRFALNGSFEQPWGEARRVSLGGNLSTEHDFFSAGFNGALAQDFNEKNTTLSLVAAVELDRINPEGGIPVALQPAFGPTQIKKPDDTRQVFDLLAGVTQVMNRRWLMQFNVNIGQGRGYHTDPYKLLSVVDGNTGLLAGDRYVAESRPRTRQRIGLYLQNKLHLASDVIDASYRYYRDDWGIRAHTVDARYRHELGGGLYLEPHARLYRQNAADFYRGWLVEQRDWNTVLGTSSLAHASADTRLAAFTATTLGLKFAMPINERSEFALRFELYRQKQKTPAPVPGVLQALDLTPDLKATTFMLGYSLAL